MRSTMMDDYQLTIRAMFDHGRRVYGGSEVLTFEGESTRRATFAEVAERTERLAAALARLGVTPGDRVGTFCWNSQEHLEAYFAVPSMGAVLHTLNLRLFPDQLTFVINHAADKVIIVDDSLVPPLARVAGELKTVEHFIVVGDGSADGLRGPIHRYDELLAAEESGFAWPDVDERSAAAMCYTTGTTGDPKGVAYSHRSCYLHSFGVMAGATNALTEKDTILPVVPMFHAMAWGLPYAGWFSGSSFLMPGRFLQAEPLVAMIEQHKPTLAGAVPTIWNDVLRHTSENRSDLSSFRMVVCGGSAVPQSLIERFQEVHGVPIIQGWGMTETSPLGAMSFAPKGTPPEEEFAWRAMTGRVIAGIELRIVNDEGTEQPWDGTAVGEIQARGPWVTASYYNADAPEKFDGGWLRTGDVGSITPDGFVQISDRAKDVIKSGGEWISSVALENTIMGHEAVLEATVIGVPDDTWDERPLACVVLNEGAKATADELRDYLTGRVVKWWLPERWTFVTEIPKTSVGKFDKKVLRAKYAAGELDVIELGAATR